MSYVPFLYIMRDHAATWEDVTYKSVLIKTLHETTQDFDRHILYYIVESPKYRISKWTLNIVCLASVETGSVWDTNVSRFISHIIWRWHDDVIKWRHFPRYWPFVRGIHRSPVNSPHKGQWRGAFDVFFDLRLNKRLSKQPWGWWFETPTHPLWRHCNGSYPSYLECG